MLSFVSQKLMDVGDWRGALLQFVNTTILSIFSASRASESGLPCCEVGFNVLRGSSQIKSLSCLNNLI